MTTPRASGPLRRNRQLPSSAEWLAASSRLAMLVKSAEIYDALEIVFRTRPSSRGWRSTSNTWRRHAAVHPARGCRGAPATPHPAAAPGPADPPDLGSWGDVGRDTGGGSPPPCGLRCRPATRWMRVFSTASARVMAGGMVVRRRANASRFILPGWPWRAIGVSRAIAPTAGSMRNHPTAILRDVMCRETAAAAPATIHLEIC